MATDNGCPPAVNTVAVTPNAPTFQKQSPEWVNIEGQQEWRVPWKTRCVILMNTAYLGRAIYMFVL